MTEKIPAWELVLQQIGIPYQTVGIDESVRPSDTAVIIVNSPLHQPLTQNILQYLQEGGVVLTEADIAARVFGVPASSIYIKYTYPQDDGFLWDVPLCDLEHRCLVATGAQYLPNQNHRKTIAVMPFGKGKMVILPSKFTRSLLEWKIKRKNFPTRNSPRFPSERVSMVSKGSIRYIVQKVLEYLFHTRDLPFVHLWYFPGDAPTIFGFRVDTDFSARDDINTLYNLCRRNGIRATWFVDTKTQADNLPIYGGMKNQEIAFHGHRHRIFSNYRENYTNFQRGLTILHHSGITPRGVAAPYGEWHPVLGKIIEDFNFLYSSEFGCVYDDVPSYPFLENSFSPALQVPIHPISVGRLGAARLAHQQMKEYYRQLICENLMRDFPVFIYHHPGQKKFDIFEKLFKEVNRQDIRSLTFEDYARWWHRRNNFKWEARIENGNIRLFSDQQDESIRARILLPSGKIVLNPIPVKSGGNRGIQIAKKDYDPLPVNPKLLRRYTLRMFYHDWLWRKRKWTQ